MEPRTTDPEPADEPDCAIERSLRVLGERWTLLILREIFTGTHKYADIREALGVAPNILSARLKTLVSAGVLETRAYREPGCRHRDAYHLTPAGRDLRLVLAALQQWGDTHRPRPQGPCLLRRTRSTGRPVDVAFVSEQGQAVGLSDVVFLPNTP
ncbi:winged helix-turn-helix transcriptional regulator [Streptomyces malaysiensis]|uniref:HxlR family transcriptional regulator n=1 Tax=Streptomyces malaysiensis TaxID=92644 RepID=A0A7X5X1D2_STRMQ|nr:helix-turn-helix domain-containing protein [Streptomyces malaysiensis]NIY63716.1 HxlR family transcriptional regulator [Streptomyces malaysiensis]